MSLTLVFTVLICCGSWALDSVPDGGEPPEFCSPQTLEVGSDGQAPQFVSETPELQTRRQFKTAEMADAVLGAELSADAAGIEALIPKSLKDSLFGVSEACEGGGCKAEGSADEQPVETTAGAGVSALVDEQNSTEMAKTYKVSCDKRSITGLESFTVHVLNASQDLMEFLNANSTECTLVLFYTTWCQFSANLAPHFNALPRVFPSMHFLALDASQHSSLSTRFGTVAVPNILLFQGAKPMARFNHTDRTLETLTSFITNQTGFEAVLGQAVGEEDRAGPLPSVPVRSVDWLFVFSVLFILGFSLYAILRTDSIRLLIPGQEHEHQD
ncbi:thioredoxin domain-containing protein 15 [Salminus brasiliensis]|uniref:thioredoxin domain-containing protein 15 n=1 Tax=Salminus brasiliensis TaxID=930266 RepID=UPI003B836BEA